MRILTDEELEDSKKEFISLSEEKKTDDLSDELLSTGETIAAEAAYGVYDLAKHAGLESTTMEELREDIDRTYELSPSDAKDMLVGTAKYSIDALMLAKGIKLISKTKEGSKLVSLLAKKMSSKDPRVAMLSTGAMVEAEEFLSSELHHEEYTAGLGFATGSVIGGAISKGRKLKDAATQTTTALAMTKAIKKLKERNNEISTLSSSTEKKEEASSKVTTEEPVATREDFDLSTVAKEDSELKESLKDTKITLVSQDEMDFIRANKAESESNVFFSTEADNELLGLSGNHIITTKQATIEPDFKDSIKKEVISILDKKGISDSKKLSKEIFYEESEFDEFFKKQQDDTVYDDLIAESQMIEPVTKSHPRFQEIKDLELDRDFFTKDIKEIRSHYSSLSDEGKLEFIGKFKKLSDIDPQRKPIEVDYDRINDLENSIVQKNTDIKKSIQKIEKLGKKAASKKSIVEQKELKAKVSGLRMGMAKEKKELRQLRGNISSLVKEESKLVEEVFNKPELFDFYRQEISDGITRKIKDLTGKQKYKKKVAPRKEEPVAKKPKKKVPTSVESKSEHFKKKHDPEQATYKKESRKEEPKARREKEGVFKAKDAKKHIKFSKEQEELYDKLSKVIPRETEVSWSKDFPKTQGGAYNTETGNIRINSTFSDKKNAQHIIHELIHAATYDAVRKNPALEKELNEILDYARSMTGSKGHWQKDYDELLAQFFSEELVFKGIKDIEVNRDILYRVANFIRKVVGMKKLPTTVEERLNKVLDDILEKKIPKESKVGSEELDIAISKAIDKGVIKINRTLRKHGILKINKEGTVEVGRFETDAFKSILNDIGVANKKTTAAIKNIRSKTLAAKKEIAEVSKNIARTIEDSPESDKTIAGMIEGRVATVLYKHSMETIKKTTIDSVSRKNNIDKSQLEKLVLDFGQKGVGQKNHYKNSDDLLNFLKASKVKTTSSFRDEFEILVAKRDFDFKKEPSRELVDALYDLEKLEDVVLKNKRMQGYMGFHGTHDFNLKVAKSKDEINLFKKDKNWKQVKNSNTFYQLNIEPDISDGILPSSKKEFQGTIISSKIEENMKRLDEEGIPYSTVRSGSKIVQLRLFPSKDTMDVLGYSTSPSKLMARKYRLLSQEAVRVSIAKNIDNEIKNLFSNKPQKGFVSVDENMSYHYKKMLGLEDKELLYVRKDMANLLVGVKETSLFGEKNRLGRMAEIAYKDLFRRFKRAVTVKSPSSIVNNYIVSFSMLAMSGAKIKDIPKYISGAHKDYSDFTKGMETYYKIKISAGEKEAEKYLAGLRKRNIVAEMMADGHIQSGVDDAIIQLNNEADMFQYMSDKVFGFNETKIDRIVDNIELKPNSEIGKFFMNKFVMADIIGRASMYTYLKRSKGLTPKQAGKQTSDLFVDFSSPLPESIRVLEEYGVPFIGWMYKVQMPLFKLMKENPTSTASVIAAYYGSQAIFDDNKDRMSDGYAGDLKIDSWFFHNSFADTGVFSMSPIVNGELPDIVPQAHKEISGVLFGNKNPLEVAGLNIKQY